MQRTFHGERDREGGRVPVLKIDFFTRVFPSAGHLRPSLLSACRQIDTHCAQPFVIFVSDRLADRYPSCPSWTTRTRGTTAPPTAGSGRSLGTPSPRLPSPRTCLSPTGPSSRRCWTGCVRSPTTTSTACRYYLLRVGLEKLACRFCRDVARVFSSSGGVDAC